MFWGMKHAPAPIPTGSVRVYRTTTLVAVPLFGAVTNGTVCSMMLESSKGSLEAFARELEFRANLFRRPLDSEALQKLQPQPCDVFRAARLAGADSEDIKTYISGLAARKVCLKDADTPGVPLLTEDAILHLANAEWSDFWQVQPQLGDVVLHG